MPNNLSSFSIFVKVSCNQDTLLPPQPDSISHDNEYTHESNYPHCILTLQKLITHFAAQKSLLTSNFQQQSLRLNIWMKFIEETPLYSKVRSTAFALMFCGGQKHQDKSCWSILMIQRDILYKFNPNRKPGSSYFLKDRYRE